MIINNKKINLKEIHYNMLKEIFNNYCPNAEIIAYGSRVNGDSHSGSDLDLTIKNFNEKNKYLYELKELINESNIPFLVDINIYEDLPKSFQQEINKNYVILFNNEINNNNF